MGFNTVAFLLNDYKHLLEQSPKTVAYALMHPPLGKDREAFENWRSDIRAVAQQHNEPMLHHQALEVLPSFHASNRQWLTAGKNSIDELTFVRFSKNNAGKKLVTLELPHWWTEGFEKYKSCPKSWVGADNVIYYCALLEDHEGNSHQCLCGVPFNLCKKHAPEGIR